MKTRKRTWKRLAFFDSGATIRYLEKQAREGWVLENVFGIWWTFRRVEPRTAHVWVTYLDQDAYEPQPSQQVEDLAELGEHTGWKMYTVTLVKLPILYDLCREEMLWADHEQVDPSPWLAQEAYRETDHGRLRTYLLCYQDCVVEITFGWEPTQEQTQLVGEIFGGLQ